MTWYLAPSLVNLRNKIHATWPNHDRTSDGSIGDPAHSSTSSDHNPNSRGSVNAIDEDKDGIDVNRVISWFENHPSSHYWIYWHPGTPYPVIADKDNGWQRVRYTGSNPHDKHIHMSIKQSQSAEQNQTPWGEEEEMAAIDQHHAIWDDFTVSETGDFDGDGDRDLQTMKQIVLNVHDMSVKTRNNVDAMKDDIQAIKTALGLTE